MTENTSTEESLTDRANRLAREAVKLVMSYHNPSPVGPATTVCTQDGYVWPCPTVADLSEAEEAISVAEEAEERAANGPYYCGVEVRRARLYGEAPEPAEYCENEVDAEGEPCAEHDDHNPDNGVDDDEEYERYKESRLGL